MIRALLYARCAPGHTKSAGRQRSYQQEANRMPSPSPAQPA